MASTPAAPFVGRAAEMARLNRALTDALGGERRVVLIGGEPGIGKTRLCEELAAHAARLGAAVSWGRSWELDGAPPLWPWTQVLRSVLLNVGPATLSARLGRDAALLAPLLPWARELLPGVASSHGEDASQARFQLFEAIADVLERCARERPQVIVLDDLHTADRASLLALEFLARDMRPMWLLLIGTYRDAVIDPDSPLVQSLPELGRTHATERMHLAGLAPGEVAELVTRFTGQRASARLGEHLYRRTDGHPLFLIELLRALALEGGLADIEVSLAASPGALRDAVGRHLAPLPYASRAILRGAAVLGREFGYDLLAAATGLPQDTLSTVLDEAVSAGVLAPETQPGHYRFTHVIVRDVLYAELPRADRITVHRRVAQALAARPEIESRLAQIAYHLVESGPTGDEAMDAVGYATRAAEHAASLSAFEEAARLYGLALQTVSTIANADPRVCADLLVARGDAFNGAGEIDQAKEVFVTAAAAARALGDRQLLARAVLGYGGSMAFPDGGFVDTRHIRLLEEAIAAWGDEPTGQHARLLGRLAAAQYFTNAAPRRSALAARAIDMARRLGDQQTLAHTLADEHTASWGPDAGERLAIATELLQIAERTGNRSFAFTAHQNRLCDLIELDDVGAAAAEFEACARLAMELREPASAGWVLVFRALRATLEGRFDDAKRHTEEVLMSGRWLGVAVERIHTAQHFVLGIVEDRWQDIMPLVQAAAGANPGIPAMHSGLALIYGQLGYRDALVRECEQLVDRLDDFPRDRTYIITLCHIGQACALAGDRVRAGKVYEHLGPHEGLNVTVGNIFGYLGPVSYYLGIMAGAVDEPNQAAVHFERAMEACRRWQARPWLAHAQYDFAAMLSATPAGAARARALLRDARETTMALGMTVLSAQVDALAVRLDSRKPAIEAQEGTSAPPWSASPLGKEGESRAVDQKPETCLMRCEGDVWSITFAGMTHRLKDTRGLRYLAHLFAHPRREFHVNEIVGLNAMPLPSLGNEPAEQPTAPDLGDAGDVLDAQATAQYHRRLSEVRQDHEEAQADNDVGRSARLREEMEFLIAELTSAGRARRAASHAERARSAVGKRIRDALRQISAVDPILGGYLRATVRTGTFCGYSPDPRLRVECEL